MLTTYAATAHAPAGWVNLLRSDLADNQSFAIGSVAPPVSLRTADGKALSLASFKGKLVYLLFWDSRFPAGQRELPYIKELTAALAGQPIVLVMAAMDDPPTNWQQTVGNAKPPYGGVQAFVPASQKEALRQAYSIERMPSAVVIAEDGTLLDLHPRLLSSRALQDDLKAAVGRAAAYRAVALNNL